MLERDAPVDVLVYSAGEPVMGRTLAVSVDDARRSFEVNFWGLDRAVRTVLPGMLERRRGVVVAVLSVAALVPVAYEAYYGAAKAAAARYLENLEVEHAGRGVGFKGLYPGFVDTGFISRHPWAGTAQPAVRGSGTTADDVADAAFELAGAREQRRVVGWRERGSTSCAGFSPGLHGRWARRAVDR